MHIFASFECYTTHRNWPISLLIPFAGKCHYHMFLAKQPGPLRHKIPAMRYVNKMLAITEIVQYVHYMKVKQQFVWKWFLYDVIVMPLGYSHLGSYLIIKHIARWNILGSISYYSYHVILRLAEAATQISMHMLGPQWHKHGNVHMQRRILKKKNWATIMMRIPRSKIAVGYR